MHYKIWNGRANSRRKSVEWQSLFSVLPGRRGGEVGGGGDGPVMMITRQDAECDDASLPAPPSHPKTELATCPPTKKVSMPTGSLCAERNVIGSALAADLTLLRRDIKAVAVLSMPKVGRASTATYTATNHDTSLLSGAAGGTGGRGGMMSTGTSVVGSSLPSRTVSPVVLSPALKLSPGRSRGSTRGAAGGASRRCGGGRGCRDGGKGPEGREDEERLEGVRQVSGFGSIRFFFLWFLFTPLSFHTGRTRWWLVVLERGRLLRLSLPPTVVAVPSGGSNAWQ